MPITNDRKMIRHFLDALNKDLMPQKGKLPQNILPLAKKLLDPTQVPGTLLLVGDGSTQETSKRFSKFFATESHQLIVWAIGKEPQSSQPKDSNIIPMQLQQLQNLSKMSKGRLVTLKNDKSDLQEIHRLIENNLVISDDESRPWLDSGYPITFVMAFIFLFWFRQGWTLQW
jgi:Ca-activated chloride channel family protein